MPPDLGPELAQSAGGFPEKGRDRAGTVGSTLEAESVLRGRLGRSVRSRWHCLGPSLLGRAQGPRRGHRVSVWALPASAQPPESRLLSGFLLPGRRPQTRAPTLHSPAGAHAYQPPPRPAPRNPLHIPDSPQEPEADPAAHAPGHSAGAWGSRWLRPYGRGTDPQPVSSAPHSYGLLSRAERLARSGG